jgi:hypothetical protein
MPLLYGEGETKAFYRLQEEILKNSDDQSLLAWTEPTTKRPEDTSGCGPLAKHPRNFQNSSRIVPLPGVSDTYLMTSSGLRIDILLVPPNFLLFQPGSWGVLRCHYENDFTGPLAIPLVPHPWQGHRVYARGHGHLITIERSKLTNHDIFQNGPFVSHNLVQPQNQTIIIHRDPNVRARECEHLYLESWPTDCTLIKAIPEEQWDPKSRIMVTDDYSVTRVFIFEHVISKIRFAIVFCYSYQYPEEPLGVVKLFEVDKALLSNPPWQHDGMVDMGRDINWEKDLNIDPVLLFSERGVQQSIKAALSKGHIMGVPFFVLNFQIFMESLLRKLR